MTEDQLINGAEPPLHPLQHAINTFNNALLGSIARGGNIEVSPQMTIDLLLQMKLCQITLDLLADKVAALAGSTMVELHNELAARLLKHASEFPAPSRVQVATGPMRRS